jgi:hypothetical protein
MDLNDRAPMSSTLNAPKVDPKDIPTLAPEVVVTRADHDVAKPDPGGKPAASAAQKGAEAAASAKAPPVVDTTFRATSTDPVKTDPVKGDAPKSFGRRLLRGVIGMILTACVAGAAMLWQSHSDVVRQIVTKSVGPIVVALLSRKESQAVEEPSGSPVVQASVAPAASPPSASQNAADNPSSTAASPSPEAAQLLQSLARELTNLRQDMEQMKAAIAELKASDDQMAREIVKASDRATDKALEQALRPKVSMASPPQAQPIAIPVRRPPQPPVARPVQSRPVSATPQAAAYVPRPSESRAAATPPQSAAAPPMDLSAPPRPPGALREQMP